MATEAIPAWSPARPAPEPAPPRLAPRRGAATTPPAVDPPSPSPAPAAPEEPREGRRLMLLGAFGATCYLAVLWLCRSALAAPEALYVLLAAMVAVNLGYAATADRWMTRPSAVLLYACIHQLLWTIHLHLLGGVQTGFFFVLNVFPMLFAAMLGAERMVFVTANVGVGIVGLLAWAETSGVLTPSSAAVGPPLPMARAPADVLFGAIVLNFVALFASRHGNLLRHFASRLQGQVGQRTAALTAANIELEQKQDEIRTFVYTVTHDLKTPLNAILLTADMALERDAATLPPATREDLSHIVRLASFTEDMIRDLLALFQVTSQPEPWGWVDLARLLERSRETFGSVIARKAITLDTGPLPAVWGQAGKLGHVIDNLIGNAVKYVPNDTGRIDVTGNLDDAWVEIHVRDNGVGIPAIYHDRIFKLFGRVPPAEQGLTEAAVEGTGVGLTLARRIVLEHAGTLTVRSAPGRGSTFTMRLPRNPPGGCA